MIKTFISNLADKFKKLTPVSQGLIILAIILIIGIILRWDHIVEQVKKGFEFYGG